MSIIDTRYRPMSEVDRLLAGILAPGNGPVDPEDESFCVEDAACIARHHTRCCPTRGDRR